MTTRTTPRDETMDDSTAGVPGFLSHYRRGSYPNPPQPLVAAVTALERLDQIEQAPQAPYGLAAFYQSVTEDALNGKDFPADFASAAHAAQVASDRQAAQAAALEGIRRQVTAQLPRVVSASLAELLDGLRAELETIVTEARAADTDLGNLDPTNPDAVATGTNKQRAAVGALAGLRPRYNRVRVAQKSALAASDRHPIGWTPWSVDQTWTHVWASGLHEYRDGATGELAGAAVSRFLEVIRRGDVWLPSVEEMEATWAAKHAPIQTASASTPSSSESRAKESA